MKHIVPEKRSYRWRVLARVVLFLFGSAVVLAVAAPLMPTLARRWSEFVLGTVASLWTFALTVLFVRWDRLGLENVGAAPGRRSLPHFGLGIVLSLLLVTLWATILAAGSNVRWVRAPEIGFAATMMSLVVYLVLACREELAFRGYPLRRLERSFGTWGAQLFVALVFAAEHRVGGWSWAQAALGAGVGSLLFGMAALATRGLALPIGLHAAWNFGQWTLGLKGEPGLWQALVEEGRDGRTELVRTVSYLAVMGSATLAFWWWHRRAKQSAALES